MQFIERRSPLEAIYRIHPITFPANPQQTKNPAITSWIRLRAPGPLVPAKERVLGLRERAPRHIDDLSLQD